MTNIQRYGTGLLGDLKDISDQDIGRLAREGWHVRGTVDFRHGAMPYAAVLEKLAAAGVGCLPVLFWTTDRGTPITPGHPSWSREQWAGHCQTFANLLGVVPSPPQQVEVWNEQNSMDFWWGTARSAYNYLTHMLVPANRALGERCMIVCGGLSFRERPPSEAYPSYRNRRAEAWLADFVKLDGHKLVDRWSIHPYGRTNSEGGRVSDRNISWYLAQAEIRRFKRKLNELGATRTGVGKPVWVTETGLSTKHNGFTLEDQEAFLRKLVGSVVDAGGYGVKLWSNWSLRDPYPASPALYYSGLYHPGSDFEGTDAQRKPAGDWWASR